MSKYEVIIYWSQEDEVFIVEVPELSGCAAHGATQEAALASSQEAVNLPRLSGEGPVVRRTPGMNRVVGLLHAVIGAHMHGHRRLARRGLDRMDFAFGFKRAHNLNSKVHVHRHVPACRMMVEKHVVT